MPDETATPVETPEPPTAPSAPAELPEGAPVESAAEPAETFETILERFEAESDLEKRRAIVADINRRALANISKK